jgi:hypothetical protein
MQFLIHYHSMPSVDETFDFKKSDFRCRARFPVPRNRKNYYRALSSIVGGPDEKISLCVGWFGCCCWMILKIKGVVWLLIWRSFEPGVAHQLLGLNWVGGNPIWHTLALTVATRLSSQGVACVLQLQCCISFVLITAPAVNIAFSYEESV